VQHSKKPVRKIVQSKVPKVDKIYIITSQLNFKSGSAPVKEQVLSMVQAWNHAFRNNTKYQPILATYNLMKMEGKLFFPFFSCNHYYKISGRNHKGLQLSVYYRL